MIPFKKHALLAAVFGVALLLGAQVGTQAMAQSSQDMSLLTEQERLMFNQRLQKTSSSAERAKITAEMNRIVQERRLELRHKKGKGSQQGGPGKK